jgi:acetyl esterase/lipase
MSKQVTQATESNRQVRHVPNQVYSHAGGKERLVDLYLPVTSTSPVPVVIWLHGGGWRFGDRHLSPDLSHFAERSGLAVVTIDYRLSDEAKFPAQTVDVKASVRWVRSVADRFGFDGDYIGLWGSSAGGHLAACAALSQERQFLSEEHAGYPTAVQAVVNGYGPMNFARIDSDRAAMPVLGSDAESIAVGSVLPACDPDSFESRLLGTAVSTSALEVELADPVHYVRDDSPPFLIMHGEADTLIPPSQSRSLFDALSDAGNDATLVLFEKLKHGFFNNPDLPREAYGTVTVLRSRQHGSRTSWDCNPAEDVFSMASEFFKLHLTK